MLTLTDDGRVASPAALLWSRRDVSLPLVIEDGGHTWTWSELAAGSARVAERLGDLDGRTVVVSARNGGTLVCGLFGVWLAGGVPAPVSPKLPASERDRILATLDAPLTCAGAEAGFTPDVLLDEKELLAAPTGARHTPPRPLLQDPGIILCTSGTTGSPKAVVQTVRGVWGLVDSVASRPVDPEALPTPLPEPPRRIEPKPMTHIGALFGLMFDLWRGRSFIVMQRFEPVRYAALVREHNVSTVSVVPSMLRMLLDADVGELKPPAVYATTGTAALPESLRVEFEQRFGLPIQLTYGQTESCGAIAYEPLDYVLSGIRRVGSSGRVVPQIEMEVRDDEGNVLPFGEVGHLWIRGEAIRPTVIGDESGRLVDGWLSTGDLGCLDADRYVYLTGRQRELIVRGGLKVVPAEVENALLEHPQVSEAAVAGRADDRLGEVPVAWVRLTGAPPTTADLLDHLRTRVAAYKLPVAVHVVTEFPRTDTGKVRKNELVEPIDLVST
ncbi:MAG: class I adenylate-forming enzyme family protein [Mycobacteriales bacterium]